MNYLPNYDNPCWMSTISLRSPKKDPKTKVSRRDGTARKADHRKATDQARLRCLPGVYQIGAAGSGTTDLYTVVGYAFIYYKCVIVK